MMLQPPEPMHPLEAVLAFLAAVGIAAVLGVVVLGSAWVAGKWRGRGR